MNTIESHCKFDERDAVILADRIRLRDQFEGPRIGDYVHFESGEIERISWRWLDGVQTSKGGGFHLGEGGEANFSGGLNPLIPHSSLLETDESTSGYFWFFHHGIWGASRGVGGYAPCRVFKTTAPYDGRYPSRSIRATEKTRS